MHSPKTSETFAREAVATLIKQLERVPFLKIENPQFEVVIHSDPHIDPARDRHRQVDATITVRHGRTEWLLVLDVQKHPQLRDARFSLDRLELVCYALKRAYPILIAQYLSPSIRALCVERNIGFCDFSDNCRLVFNDVFIEREVPISQTPEPKRLKSLFSPKSSRVIRRLLHDPNHLWKVQKLAEAAVVSPATVSLIKDKLLGEEYAVRNGEAFIITKPEELLLDWARHYTSHQHNQIQLYGRGDLDELESRFSSYCRQHSINYGFTMFSGARRVAAFTRGIQRAYAYASSDSDALQMAKALELKPVDSGDNFRLITPNDDDVLWDKQEVDGQYVVNDIQLYLDLAGHRGRGEENAEFLLEQRIRPRW